MLIASLDEPFAAEILTTKNPRAIARGGGFVWWTQAGSNR
jgi:hypothetical protein